MMRVVLVLLACAMPAVAIAQAAPSADIQIAQALLAAPDDRRDGAAVLGFAPDGTVTTLRPGSNDLICMGDHPRREGISVACYHKDLEPFMARGRELTAKGVTEDTERDQTRFDEARRGTLAMPKEPRILYVTTGTAFDPATNALAGAYTRWVIYVPFATGASTGLMEKPGAPGAPWLMDGGTPGAHIMISPPRSKP